MALVLDDRVQETTTTTGTGTLTLAGATIGYQSFAAIGNGNTTYYCITDGTNWEVGIGTYTSSGTTLARTTVLKSSNSNSLVNFSAGTKTVFVTYPASKSIYTDYPNTFGFKNRIINGAMIIDQRNAGASVTPINLQYSVDRWQSFVSAASKFTVQQNAGSVTPPAGYINYLGVTSSSAYSLAAGDYFTIQQRIEGLNVADLAFGTASAATVALSFWVRSSLTGTFGGVICNQAQNRCYPFSYTISAANTWEQKTLTIAGDTTGTWLKTNETGMFVVLSLGTGTTYSGTAGAWSANTYISATGATSVVGTSGATFYVTGVQLEKSSIATSFDYRDYGTELGLCLRYYWQMTTNATPGFFFQGYTFISFQFEGIIEFPVPMRSAATLTSSPASQFVLRPSTVAITLLSGYTGGQVGSYNNMLLYTANAPTLALGYAQSLISNSATSTFIGFSAEL